MKRVLPSTNIVAARDYLLCELFSGGCISAGWMVGRGCLALWCGLHPRWGFVAGCMAVSPGVSSGLAPAAGCPMSGCAACLPELGW